MTKSESKIVQNNLLNLIIILLFGCVVDGYKCNNKSFFLSKIQERHVYFSLFRFLGQWFPQTYIDSGSNGTKQTENLYFEDYPQFPLNQLLHVKNIIALTHTVIWTLVWWSSRNRIYTLNEHNRHSRLDQDR